MTNVFATQNNFAKFSSIILEKKIFIAIRFIDWLLKQGKNEIIIDYEGQTASIRKMCIEVELKQIK